MALSLPKPCHQLGLDDAECSSDEDILPRQVINHYVGHSDKCAETYRDLQVIAEQLERYSNVTKDFLDAFPEWKLNRKRNIASFTDIIKKLDEIHLNTNIVKTTASVGGIISAIVGVAGAAVAMFSGHSSAFSMQLGAGIGNLLSSAVNSGAVVTESSLSKSYMNNAKQLLQEDCKHFEAIQQWFEYSEDLKNAIERICNYDVMLDVCQKLKDIVPQMNNVFDTLSLHIDEVTEQVVNMLSHKNISHIVVEKIILLFCHNQKLLESIRKLYQMIQNTPSIMPLVTMCVKVPHEMKFLSNRICDSNVKSSANRNTLMRDTFRYGLFQGVNVALEAYSLTLLANDFQNGSTSEHSALIREVRNHLKLQYNLVSDVYKKLKYSE